MHKHGRTCYNGIVTPEFKRSSRCTGGNCVEVAVTGDAALVRDSKNPDQPHLVFSAEAWREFAAGFQAGEFERL